MTPVETKWTITVDTATCKVTFRVQYRSDLPPDKHEEIHHQIKLKAEELLRQFWGEQAKLMRCAVEIEPLAEQPRPNDGVATTKISRMEGEGHK